MSDSLQPHESQHARPPCPSPTPGVHSDSHPSSQWCHLAISSSVVPFSSCPQSLPASESFPMSQLSTWGGQSTGVSALASFLPKNPRADLLQNGLVGSLWSFSFSIIPSKEIPGLITRVSSSFHQMQWATPRTVHTFVGCGYNIMTGTEKGLVSWSLPSSTMQPPTKTQPL